MLVSPRPEPDFDPGRCCMSGKRSLICVLILLSVAGFPGPRPTLRQRAPPRPPPRPRLPLVAANLKVGSLTLHACRDAQAYCGSIDRALDPSGTVAGTIKIGFEFYPHTDNSRPPLDPIVAEEGGP